jgi:O-antigen/teichoic acid export membrane protein
VPRHFLFCRSTLNILFSKRGRALQTNIQRKIASVISSSKPHRSLGIMVIASLVSAVCGVVLTFCIPRLLSVDDFGTWRAFLLYAGYAGLMHFGLVDGALLRWSRSSPDDPSGSEHASGPSRALLGRALRFIALEHIVLLALAAGSFIVPAPPALRLLLLALALYALLFNLVGLLQVNFQTRLRFGAVAFGSTAPQALLVISLCILALTRVTVWRLLAAYLFAWTITLAVLLLKAWHETPSEPGRPSTQQLSTLRLGCACIATGWPIVLANTGFGLMQSADRVTVNLTRPLHDFAIYSLSQSTIYVPITVLAAISRVAFSWFARARHGDRAMQYATSTRLLAFIWMILLPYYFLVEIVVRRFLPRYIQGLAAGRILLLSVLFLSLIQIVQMNTFSLEGRQRQFFAGSLAAVAMAFATAWFGSQIIGTLAAVAWSQVVTAGSWWLGNEWYLRRHGLLRMRDILAVLATFTLSAIGLYLGTAASVSEVLRPAIYYAFGAFPMFVLFRADVQNGWRAALNLRPGRAPE